MFNLKTGQSACPLMTQSGHIPAPDKGRLVELGAPAANANVLINKGRPAGNSARTSFVLPEANGGTKCPRSLETTVREIVAEGIAKKIMRKAKPES